MDPYLLSCGIGGKDLPSVCVVPQLGAVRTSESEVDISHYCSHTILCNLCYLIGVDLRYTSPRCSGLQSLAKCLDRRDIVVQYAVMQGCVRLCNALTSFHPYPTWRLFQQSCHWRVKPKSTSKANSVWATPDSHLVKAQLHYFQMAAAAGRHSLYRQS